MGGPAARHQIKRLTQRDGNKCHYCSKRLEHSSSPIPQRAATRDHIVPKCFGGTWNIDNLVLACGLCNSSRQHVLSACECFRCTTVINNWKFDQMIVLDNPHPFWGVMGLTDAIGIMNKLNVRATKPNLEQLISKV